MQRMRWRRLRTDEDGAVAIIFVLMLMPLFALAALVVDIGASYTQKYELQNATDAAALAIAQDCVRGTCGDTTATAQNLTTSNAGAGSRVAAVVGTSTVTVRANATVAHWFAPAIGVESSDVGASSTARFGAPSGATAVLPLIFSWCSFSQQTGISAQTGRGQPSNTTPLTIHFSKTDGTIDCTGPSGNAVPGGFAWIQTAGGTCATSTTISTARLLSDPGASIPSACSTADLTAVHGKTVLLPIFDTFGGTGSGAWYQVYAYAAFRLTGYHFTGQYRWNSPCSGNDRCISGYFTSIVLDPAAPVTYSATAPNLGASLVALTS